MYESFVILMKRSNCLLNEDYYLVKIKASESRKLFIIPVFIARIYIYTFYKQL